MTGKAGPIWLCEFTGKPSIYAYAPSASVASAECRESGLGTPTATHYAGYVAEPGPIATPPTRHAIPLPSKPSGRSARRAELVLTLYGLLRCDWPIGSILRPDAAAARLPSQSALRDFLANVGLAIERISGDSRIVDETINSQGNAWIEAANEKNAKRSGKWRLAEVHAEMKIRHRMNAKRLRKRVGYRKAIAELAFSIDGLLPCQDRAAENFRTILADSGLGSVDVDSLVNRFRRITAPKL